MAGCCASQDVSSLHREAQEDKACLHHLLSVLLTFCYFRLDADVCDYIALQINSLFSQNKLCVASQKPDLGNRHVSTFSFKKMHLNNNGEENRTRMSHILKICTEEKSKIKTKTKFRPHPRMIYDSAGELHAVIHLVDHGFVRQ